MVAVRRTDSPEARVTGLRTGDEIDEETRALIAREKLEEIRADCAFDDLPEPDDGPWEPYE